MIIKRLCLGSHQKEFLLFISREGLVSRGGSPLGESSLIVVLFSIIVNIGVLFMTLACFHDDLGTLHRLGEWSHI